MGWLVRTLTAGASTCIVACAAIAGIGEPDESTDPVVGTGPMRDEDGGAPSSSGGTSSSSGSASSSSGSSGTPGDAAANDAAPDSPPPPPVCTDKAKNGEPCTVKDACCSNNCNELKVCVASCRSGGSSCNPLDQAPCCVGYYCLVAACAPCIPQNGTPSAAGSKSCCSKQIDGATSKCK